MFSYLSTTGDNVCYLNNSGNLPPEMFCNNESMLLLLLALFALFDELGLPAWSCVVDVVGVASATFDVLSRASCKHLMFVAPCKRWGEMMQICATDEKSITNVTLIK